MKQKTSQSADAKHLRLTVLRSKIHAVSHGIASAHTNRNDQMIYKKRELRKHRFVASSGLPVVWYRFK